MLCHILRSPYLHLIFILLPIIAFFSPVIFHHHLALPADTIPGLHHPLLDAFRSTYPNGPPYKNYLITDSIRQQYPWREFSISQLKSGQIPWWNPYNFSGTPHLANFQSATFYPLNFIFWLLEFSTGWNLLVLLQPVLGAIFAYLYLRHLQLHPLASIFGSITWIFSGFFIAWLEWNTAVHVAIWTPLILLCLDKLIVKHQVRFSFILAFALLSQLFAGYPQPWLYLSLLQFAYLIFRLRSHPSPKTIATTFVTYTIFLFIGSIQLVPTFQYSPLTNRDLDQGSLTHNLDRLDWFLPYQNLIQLIVPDFFGNPATLNYWGVFNYTEFVSFIGIIPAFFVLLSLTRPRNPSFYFFFLITALISLVAATKNPLSLLQTSSQFPFIGSSQPSRWLVITDLSLSFIAAFGLHHFLKAKPKLFFPILTLILVLTLSWIATLTANHWLPPDQLIHISVTQRNLILPTLELALVTFLFLIFIHNKSPRNLRPLLALILIAISSFTAVRFARKFTPFSNRQFLYPQSSILTYLQQHANLYRYTTTDRRIMAPNLNLPYRLYSIEGYDPMYLTDYGKLITAADTDHFPDQSRGFNRIVIPEHIPSPIVNLLSVKYILSLNLLEAPDLEFIMEEGSTKLYQNHLALPRAFTTTVTNPFFLTLSNTSPATITSYTPNRIVISVSLSHPATLILTDSFYPDWQATLDGSFTPITNWYGLRATIVPRGDHEIIYHYRHPHLQWP